MRLISYADRLPVSSSLHQQEGVSPIPRDSHVALVHQKSMWVFGGSSGQALDDLHELNLETYKWTAITPTSSSYVPLPAA